MHDPTPFELRALASLKEAGFRMTGPRLLVIRVLGESQRALTANAIHERVLTAGGRLDVASVYRTLATLIEQRLVHHVGIVDGYVACSSGHDHGPAAQHLVCRSCGRVTELEVEAGVIESATQVASRAQFRLGEMRIEMLGLCGVCR